MFGWTLDELAGRHVPLVPPDREEESGKGIKKPSQKKFIRRFETKRGTKDGRVLDVAVRVTTFLEGAADGDGELVILRDLTREKRAACKNEVLLRISTALPGYPELEKLLDYISDEIGVLMNTEVALVTLLDEEKNEFSYVDVTEENQRHIFEGFFVTRDTMAYSSQRPFDFNAGGKGADLLRMKIFSEQYIFAINMTSSRCQFIPEDSDICPGRISRCSFCKGKEVCHLSGGAVFALFFPFKP